MHSQDTPQPRWPLSPSGPSSPYQAGRGFRRPQVPQQPRPRSARDDAMDIGVALGRGVVNALGRDRPWLGIATTMGAGGGVGAPVDADWREITYRKIQEKHSPTGEFDPDDLAQAIGADDDDEGDDQSGSEPRINLSWASEPLGAVRRSQSR